MTLAFCSKDISDSRIWRGVHASSVPVRPGTVTHGTGCGGPGFLSNTDHITGKVHIRWARLYSYRMPLRIVLAVVTRFAMARFSRCVSVVAMALKPTCRLSSAVLSRAAVKPASTAAFQGRNHSGMGELRVQL